MGIYAITCQPTGRLYVGSALNIERRWSEHRKILKPGKHHSQRLQRAWNKYGADAFTFSITEVVPIANDLVAHEQAVIDSYSWERLLNCARRAGSQLGFRHSLATKAVMRAKFKERGPVSAETRAKMSAAMIARHVANGTTAPPPPPKYPGLNASERRKIIMAIPEVKAAAAAGISRAYAEGRYPPRTEEQNRKTSATMKATLAANPEMIEKRAARLRGTTMPQEQRDKVSEGLRRAHAEGKYKNRPRVQTAEAIKNRVESRMRGNELRRLLAIQQGEV